MPKKVSGKLNRRGVLKHVATGAVTLGLGGRVVAKGDNGGSGTGRYIVGTDTKGATDKAKEKADAVHRTLSFGSIGKAVSGKFSEAALSSLQKRQDVRYVEADGQMEALGESVPWGVDRVDADVAHDNGYTGAGGDIAILDTGIDSDHSDLEANLGSGKSFVSCDSGCTSNSCHQSWDDDNGHGTHCAGIANAVNNNSDVVGVSTEATLHAVKVLDCDGYGSYSDIGAGVKHATDKGWDVASMSLGGGSSSYTLKDACQYAADNGTLVVAAAGNSGPCSDCVMYPAKYDTTIAVSATDSTDDLASFSSTGPEIEITAPGASILSTVPGGTATYSGTSMACPHVSGAAGMLMANGYTRSEARSRLAETAEDIGLSGNDQGNGLLDVGKAVSTSTSSGFGEVGSVTTSDGESWRSVSLQETYNNPVVIMKPVSHNYGDPCHVRLRNVTNDSFEFRVEEWMYLDGWHNSETIQYMVLEAGTHKLSDGTLVEAGETTSNDKFNSVGFGHEFGSKPIVFSQSQTLNGGHAIVTRQRNVSKDGFSVELQEEQAADGWHGDETVGYVAIQPNTGETGGTKYETGKASKMIDHKWTSISFDQSYSTPFFLADMQTKNGGNPSGLRYQDLDGSGTKLKVEEEQSEDEETGHWNPEEVGYFVMDGSGVLS